MIDLHSHILPGVDDGPVDLASALELARAAVLDGIELAVLTPHVHPGRYANTKTSLQMRFARFKEILKRENIPLKLRLAGEVRLSMESFALFLEDEIPFLGEVDGYKIVLLEFPHDTIPVGSEQFVAKLLDMKIRPLIAHPERNKMVMANMGKIQAFVNMGCWLQVTAGSISGRFGKVSKKVAVKLLEDELVWVIATDAHNLTSRSPNLAEGRNAVAELIGERSAMRMVLERPARILGVALNEFNQKPT